MAITTPRPQAQYRCTQEELYQVCFLTWDSYLSNVADFTSVNTTYTAAYGNTNRTAVKTAKKLPDFQARDEASESLLIQMKDTADQCLIQWNLLETHIKKSFPENLHKPKIESAGGDHYEKAGQNNWESVSALMESGNNFITNNTPALNTGGMPAGFPAAFSSAKTNFENLYTQLKDSEQDSEEARDIKINANNAIFKIITSLNEDGQKIYRNNPAKRERFTFSKVLDLVSGAGTSTREITINPNSSETVKKVRANSPIANISQVPIMVGAVNSTEQTTINPDDSTANTFGPDIKITNQHPTNPAKATVRVGQ